VIPRSGRRRRGPAVQRPGPRRSGRLTSGREPGDHHRAGHLTSGRRSDDRRWDDRRTNHGRPAGQFVRCRRPGVRRTRNARQAAAAGRHLRPDCRNGARAFPRASHPRASRRRGGHQSGTGRRGNHRCAGRRRGDWPHEGHHYVDHRPGNCPPAGCRRGHGRERGGRYSHWRSRATPPGRPGRCRCGTDPACSPVSHPTGCPGPGGCHSSCLHPDCHAGDRLGPGPSRCLNPGAAERAHWHPTRWRPIYWHPTYRHPISWHPVRWPARRLRYWAAGPGCLRPCSECCRFRRRRSGPRPHRRRVPGRLPRRDPGPRRCWDAPDHGTRRPNGSGPAPRHHYGPGRPDPARLPRSCSTLS
jgi:hypothetical protein